MAHILRNLKLDTAELLSVVDKGASGDAEHRPRIVLVKRRESARKAEGTMPKTAEEILAAMPEEDRKVMMEAMAQVATPPKPEEKAEETPPTEEPPMDKQQEEERDAMAKRDAEFKKMAEEREALAKRLAAIEDERAAEKFEKRATELSHLAGIETGELAGVLKRASSEMSADDFAKLDSMLTSTNALLAKSAAFVEHGSNHVPQGSALEKIEALAKSYKDSDPTLSMSKARTRAIEANPELYAQAQTERLGVH